MLLYSWASIFCKCGLYGQIGEPYPEVGKAWRPEAEKVWWVCDDAFHIKPHSSCVLKWAVVAYHIWIPEFIIAQIKGSKNI